MGLLFTLNLERKREKEVTRSRKRESESGEKEPLILSSNSEEMLCEVFFAALTVTGE